MISSAYKEKQQIFFSKGSFLPSWDTETSLQEKWHSKKMSFLK
jgi:hypothetical protein